MTVEELKEEVKKHQVNIIKCGAEWCGPCREMDKTLDEIQSERTDVNIIKLNVDDEAEITNYFRVRNIPTVIYMNETTIISRTIGLISKQEILDNIKNVEDTYKVNG